MKFERIKDKKKILLATVVLLLIGVTLIFKSSLAKYKTTESIQIVKGSINYSLADLNLVAIYQENSSGNYDEVSVMPSFGYKINEERSYCNVNGVKDNNVVLKTVKSNHIFGNIQKGSKCYLYFDEKPLTIDDIIAISKSGTGTPNFGNTSCTAGSNNGSNCGEATVGLYNAEDDYGTSYYFRGDVNDNYVKFAGFYWRIIRINGNGTLRLIYSGKVSTIDSAGKETVLKNGYDDSSTLYTQTQTSAFNSSYSDNTYVGFMFGTEGATDYNTTHTNTSSSTIKGVLDTWYTGNLASYASYLDTNTGFCGDRELSPSTTGTGVGTSATEYASYYRLYTKKEPSLKCTNKDRDLYTVNSANIGNKALSNPIGLITADEAAYAGGKYGASSASGNYGYYLYTGYGYRTISPANSTNQRISTWLIHDLGYLTEGRHVVFMYGVRPVINIRSDVNISGSGTIASPYEIS